MYVTYNKNNTTNNDNNFFSVPIFAFSMILSPKLRAKFLAHQLKGQKYLIEENEEMLKELNKKSADISKAGFEISARAIKKRICGGNNLL